MTKKQYLQYYKQDLAASGLEPCTLMERLLDRRFKFYKSLRMTEYYTNTYKIGVLSYWGKFLRARHRYLCDKYNWTIPINVFGPGLALVHVGTIVVSGSAKIGANCRIHVDVNIGRSPAKGISGAPVIGENVYIGPGAKIFGPITIGSNTAIGANAVVNSSFIDGNCTIGGIPAKKISDNTSERFIINAREH